MKTPRSGQREQVAPGAVTSDLLSVCKMGTRLRVLFVFGLESEGGGGGEREWKKRREARLFQSGEPPCQTTFRGTVAF